MGGGALTPTSKSFHSRAGNQDTVPLNSSVRESKWKFNRMQMVRYPLADDVGLLGNVKPKSVLSICGCIFDLS